MTDEKTNFTGSTTSTVTEQKSQALEGLSPIEEKALRMLHGLPESDSHELSFALGANDDARLKLAMMEKHLLDAFQWGELTTFKIGEQHVEAKAKIIDRLRDAD